MRITFSSASCASADFHTLAAVAQRCGFDGVELFAERNTSSISNAHLTAAIKIRETFAASSVNISAINLGSEACELSAGISLAADLRSPFVVLPSDDLFARAGTTSSDKVDRLIASADSAATAGVSILLINQPFAGSALRLWHLLDRLNHPSVGCCWDTLSAARAGDTPAVAVPMLNSRIRSVHLNDATHSPPGFAPADLGSGNLPLRKTVDRLRGIGFDGDLLVGTVPVPGQTVNHLEQSLLSARAVLQQWQILRAPILR